MRALGPAVCAAMLAWASTSAVAASGPDSSAAAASSDTSLAASAAPPWNPPAAVPAAETWETVVRTPGIILSLPLVGLGAVAKSGLAFVETKNVLPRFETVLHLQGKVGLSLLPARFGDRVGLALGVKLAPPWFRWLDAGIAASTGKYNLANVALKTQRVRLEYESAWRPKDQFFGIGLDSHKYEVSTYASQSQLARLTVGNAWQPEQRTWPEFDATAWVGGRDIVVLDGRDPRKPGVAEVHPDAAAQLLGVHIEHLIYGGEVGLDTRHGGPHWTNGYRLSARVDRFDKPIEGFVLRSAHTPGDQFLRFTYHAEGGVSFWRDPRSLRLSVKVVDQQIGSDTGIFSFPDLAKLGGQDGLVGFEPGRFQSTDATVARLAYIFPLGRYLEFDAHTELGGVYSHLIDFKPSTLEQSYGTTLRIRSTAALLGTLGFNWSRESLRFGFQIGGSE